MKNDALSNLKLLINPLIETILKGCYDNVGNNYTKIENLKCRIASMSHSSRLLGYFPKYEVPC